MLKIKDSINSDELKKYGFVYNKNHCDLYMLEFQNDMEGDIKIRITNDKVVYPVSDLDIYNLGNKNEFQMFDILYDLIKANIIEKVEEVIK